MLYINIDKSYKVDNSIYYVTYLDYPNFSFVKRIGKKHNEIDEGLDFSKEPFYYVNNTYINNYKDKLNSLIDEFKTLNIIDKICKDISSNDEIIIIHKLFSEANEKI